MEPWNKSKGLASAFVMLGAMAIVLQTLLVREFLVVFSGNELVLGIVFSIWLLGVTSGAFIGGRLVKIDRTGFKGFTLSLLLLITLSIAALILVRFARGISQIPPGQLATINDVFFATLITAFPAALPIGLIFPFAGKSAKTVGLHERSVGALYTYEAIGATLGGVVFTFLLAGRMSAFTSLAPFLLTGLFTLTAFSILVDRRRTAYLLAAICVGGIIATSLGLPGALDQQLIEKRWQDTAPGVTLVESRDSRYQHLAVGVIAGQTSIYGNGETLTSFPDPETYKNQAHLIASQHPAPKEILLIGAGSENLARFLLQHEPERLDIVQNDKILMSLMENYLPAQDQEALRNPAVNRFATDGRYYVKNVKEKYDIVALCLPDPSTAMINRFYTEEFFRMVKRILKPDGVLTLEVTSAVNYVGQEVGMYVGSIHNTLRQVFAYVVVLPEDHARMFASNEAGAISKDWQVIAKRFNERNIQDDGFHPVMFRMQVVPERIEAFENGLDKFPQNEVNTDLRPITYYYNLLLWDRFSEGDISHILSFWMKIGGVALIAGIILIECFIFFLLLTRKIRSNNTSLRGRAFWTIFSTGIAGMGLQMVILFGYQNVHGSLYEKIGFLTALFMLGLAIGGGFISWKMPNLGSRVKWLMFACDAALVLFILGLGMSIGKDFHEIFFFGAACVVGVIVGAQFPLGAAFAQPDFHKTGQTAGLIDWADHFGAFFGAGLTGVFLVPIFGIFNSCLVIGALKVGSMLHYFIRK